MSYEKVEFEPYDTLTAEHLNNMQDAIIELQGSDVVIEKLDEIQSDVGESKVTLDEINEKVGNVNASFSERTMKSIYTTGISTTGTIAELTGSGKMHYFYFSCGAKSGSPSEIKLTVDGDVVLHVVGSTAVTDTSTTTFVSMLDPAFTSVSSNDIYMVPHNTSAISVSTSSGNKVALELSPNEQSISATTSYGVSGNVWRIGGLSFKESVKAELIQKGSGGGAVLLGYSLDE